MYTVFFINFNYRAQSEFSTLAAAEEYARAAGFESAILRNGEVVARFGIISGIRYFPAVASC